MTSRSRKAEAVAGCISPDLGAQDINQMNSNNPSSKSGHDGFLMQRKEVGL